MASIKEAPVDNFRPMRVIVIGAGFSGLYLSIRIPEWLRNVDLVTYEQNAGVGGTWFMNRYPGCACDIPCRFIKLKHEVNGLHWDAESLKWKVDVKNLTTGETFIDEADVVVGARGAFTRTLWPEIDGLWDFAGKIVHSGQWDETFDYSHKRIGVIGTGSSAIQIIPQLQKLPETKLSCFIRSKTWISTSFGDSAATKLGLQDNDIKPQDRERFLTDSQAFYSFRKIIEDEGNAAHPFSLKDSPHSNAARKEFAALMRTRLAKKPELAEFLMPSFAPGCRRLTPGPGFLEALTEDNVEPITTPIRKVTPSGVVLADGREVELDVLVCATGFDAGGAPLYPVVGSQGLDLQKRYQDYPEAYLGMAVDGFPNLFLMLGANSGVGSGSLTKIIESQGDYIIKCIRKLQKEDIGAMELSNRAMRDWVRHIEGYFQRTVFLDDCKSWYRKNDRIIGLWPGSTLHAIETMRAPRWEDFNFTYADGSAEHNRLSWLGNGMTQNDQTGLDRSWYIEPEYVDVPSAPLPEQTEKYLRVPFSH
ncbi:hypothetical protein N0V91_008378 [Didymella pomorum]|uniref:Uncharacterized protein n=1 Tax=Didymella pomorum TaxID=749634 RepID=A0A9W8Z7H0_9PLEO|nr:hypothetical protein N0V91_008378 [Didymella pomorum]